MRTFKSHGDGQFSMDQFKKIGSNVVFEKDVLVFHPQNIEIGSNVYIGHRSMIKGYHKGSIVIHDNVWIGQNVFIHGANQITIGNNVGIGPNVTIFTSQHAIKPKPAIILDSPLEFKPVIIEDDVDIGCGSIVLPGVRIERGAQIGSGSVVTKNVLAYSIVAGNPAKLIRVRD